MKRSRFLLVLIAWTALCLIGAIATVRAQGPVGLCVWLINQNTGAASCQNVGQFSSSSTAYNWLPVGGVANAAAPTYVEGRLGGLSFDLSGNLRTVASASGSTAVTIADGADVAEGATADAAATQGGTGTVSAKLRLLTTQFNTLNTTVATAAAQALTQAPVAPATATATKSELAGCQATSAAINPTTGQQAAVDCDLNNNLLVSSGGAPNLATAQVSVTTGNITVAAARALRRAVTITNVTGSSIIYCGNTGVTTGTGMYLAATAGSSITLNTTAAIFCTVQTTSQTVTVAETY